MSEVRFAEFYERGGESVATQMNNFLEINKVEYVDVKYIYTENTYATQTNIMALLIYKP